MKDHGRSDRAAIAAETTAILRAGTYRAGSVTVDIAALLDASVRATETLSPSAMSALLDRASTRAGAARPEVEVTGEDTLSAARRLRRDHDKVVCLNFASARNPGGGFLGGARAQEESLCRASGLYPTLLACPEYYDANRACRELSYTDWTIHSPDVPVLRDDREELSPDPFTTSFVTMPAPNRGGGGPLSDDQVERTFRRRIAMLLALCSERGYAAVVLGAWGCGAFRNDPRVVAALFREAVDRPALTVGIERIVFAVLEHARDRGNRAAFEQAFSR